MKKIISIFFVLIGMAWACSDEPTFPDPGLDATRTSIDTVRRDTIDHYLISMDISAPNGVEKIQVLNGRDYSVIEEFSDGYYGQTELTFVYDVDLREIVTDTTLLYIVKVIDQDMRSYNKGFTLCVKKFSSPDITIVGGADVLGLVSSVFELKALFETGLNTIAGYRVLFEGNVVDEGNFSDTLVHEYKYKQVLSEEMEKEREYLLEIELTDDKGTVGRQEMKLRLVDMKRPVKVTVSTASGLNREIEFCYSQEDRLDSMFYTIYQRVLVDGYYQTREVRYRYDFHYSEEGMVSDWAYTDLESGEETDNCVYTYLSGTQRVKTIDTKEGYSKAIDVQEWYGHGGVKSFYEGTSALLVDNIHYTPEISGDGAVFSEYVSSTNRGDTYRQHAENMSAILIPTYFPELPPIMLGSIDRFWQDLFFYKYVFANTVYTYREGNAQTSQVSSSTDTMGRLTNLRRTISSTSYYDYIFTYE